MKWEDVRQAFPNEWMLIEAVEAFTNEEHERILVDITPLEKFSDSPKAMRASQALHRENPSRELYVLHTNRIDPQIKERKWVGVRR